MTFISERDFDIVVTYLETKHEVNRSYDSEVIIWTDTQPDRQEWNHYLSVFAGSNEELLKASSFNHGQTLLDIKVNTTDDHLKTSLSSLHQPGDALAQKKWDHSSHLQDAHRKSFHHSDQDNTHGMMKTISDVHTVQHVKSALMHTGGLVLSKAEIIWYYLAILKEIILKT